MYESLLDAIRRIPVTAFPLHMLVKEEHVASLRTKMQVLRYVHEYTYSAWILVRNDLDPDHGVMEWQRIRTKAADKLKEGWVSVLMPWAPPPADVPAPTEEAKRVSALAAEIAGIRMARVRAATAVPILYRPGPQNPEEAITEYLRASEANRDVEYGTTYSLVFTRPDDPCRVFFDPTDLADLPPPGWPGTGAVSVERPRNRARLAQTDPWAEAWSERTDSDHELAKGVLLHTWLENEYDLI